MTLTRKRLLVDIFFTRRLSKSLASCEFTSVNFVPWKGPHDSYIKTEEILKLLFQVCSSSEHFNITRRGQLIGNGTENWCCVLKLHIIENHQICLNWCSVRKFVYLWKRVQWNVLKYWDLLVTFKRRLLVRVVPNIVLLLRTLSWSSLLKGLGLTVIFWTLAFDYVKTIK